jgi:hypothetical protein
MSTTSETTSNTVATAAAPVTLSLSSWLKMCTEATWVLKGRFPEIRTVEPNSLIERAKARAVPAAMAGTMLGRMIRRKIFVGLAPSDAAASSMSRSSSSSTGCTVRTTKGRVTNSRATTTPERA